MEYPDDTPSEDLIISIRLSNCLKNTPELPTVGHLRRVTTWELQRIPGLGKKSARELREWVPFELRDGERRLDASGKEYGPVHKLAPPADWIAVIAGR